ncbi:MAG: hypothetical protein ACKVOW_17140 [Chitinophagaceae bacterium]
MKSINYAGKYSLYLILILFMAAVKHNSANAQTANANKKVTTVTPSQVLSYAVKAKENLGGKVYDPMLIRKKIDKSSPLYKMLPYMDKGNSLINNVVAAGSSITQQQAEKYDAEMKQVMLDIDKLSGGPQTGNEIPKCFKGCDENYPGLGGGQGWKRFTCKMACLIVETAH